jgi:1-acyl-sn-glycerol-3-phosphate acyltransferase
MAEAGSHTALIEINIDDMLIAWGLDRVRVGRGILRALARPAASSFAQEMRGFDDALGTAGLRAAGAMLCRRYTGGVCAVGLKHIPRSGPVLILANHPGLTDTVALFALIPRADLRVIALDRPFLCALPHTMEHLYLLPDDVSARVGITRAVARHLRGGGAALTFPAGEIEPDPLALSGAEASLATWSESIGLFVRLVPEAQIVVAMVGGVLNPRALRNPLTHLRRQPEDRELLAAALQLMWRPYQHGVVYVVFAPPLYATELLAQDADPARITRAVTNSARHTLANWPTQWETGLRGTGRYPDDVHPSSTGKWPDG